MLRMANVVRCALSRGAGHTPRKAGVSTGSLSRTAHLRPEGQTVVAVNAAREK